MNKLPAALVEEILFHSVRQIDLILSLHGMQIAASQKQQNRPCIQIGFLADAFCKVEQCLRQGCQNLLGRIIRLFVKLDLLTPVHLVIQYGVNVGKASCSFLPNRRKDPIGFPELRNRVRKPLLCQHIAHRYSSCDGSTSIDMFQRRL